MNMKFTDWILQGIGPTWVSIDEFWFKYAIVDLKQAFKSHSLEPTLFPRKISHFLNSLKVSQDISKYLEHPNIKTIKPPNFVIENLDISQNISFTSLTQKTPMKPNRSVIVWFLCDSVSGFVRLNRQSQACQFNACLQFVEFMFAWLPSIEESSQIVQNNYSKWFRMITRVSRFLVLSDFIVETCCSRVKTMLLETRANPNHNFMSMTKCLQKHAESYRVRQVCMWIG